jgi:hypothetical protein
MKDVNLQSTPVRLTFSFEYAKYDILFVNWVYFLNVFLSDPTGLCFWLEVSIPYDSFQTSSNKQYSIKDTLMTIQALG